MVVAQNIRGSVTRHSSEYFGRGAVVIFDCPASGYFDPSQLVINVVQELVLSAIRQPNLRDYVRRVEDVVAVGPVV